VSDRTVTVPPLWPQREHLIRRAIHLSLTKTFIKTTDFALGRIGDEPLLVHRLRPLIWRWSLTPRVADAISKGQPEADHQFQELAQNTRDPTRAGGEGKWALWETLYRKGKVIVRDPSVLEGTGAIDRRPKIAERNGLNLTH
jgi:hypothetical protein